MSRTLIRDSEMCLDSFGVVNHSIIPLQTVWPEESSEGTDINIEIHQRFAATGHFFTPTLATGYCEAPGHGANQKALYRTSLCL